MKLPDTISVRVRVWRFTWRVPVARMRVGGRAKDSDVVTIHVETFDARVRWMARAARALRFLGIPISVEAP